MNYYGSLCTFLLHCGVDHKTLLPKENRPRTIDPDPVAYTTEEVKRFMGALTSPRHRLFFQFLLKTGTREKEATHLEWSDIRLNEHRIIIAGEKRMTVVVDGKAKQLAFRTKSRRSRTIPLENNLLGDLREWRKSNPNTRFVFGTSSDLPDGHMLEVVKTTVQKTGLGCGTCAPCLSQRGCERWFLHKFRHTFATWSLQAGVDIVTVQKMLGHTKIEMTARYLGALHAKAAQEKLNAVFA
jgi:integrase